MLPESILRDLEVGGQVHPTRHITLHQTKLPEQLITTSYFWNLLEIPDTIVSFVTGLG